MNQTSEGGSSTVGTNPPSIGSSGVNVKKSFCASRVGESAASGSICGYATLDPPLVTHVRDGVTNALRLRADAYRRNQCGDKENRHQREQPQRALSIHRARQISAARLRGPHRGRNRRRRRRARGVLRRSGADQQIPRRPGHAGAESHQREKENQQCRGDHARRDNRRDQSCRSQGPGDDTIVLCEPAPPRIHRLTCRLRSPTYTLSRMRCRYLRRTP